jgi:hypothetical protein
VENPYVPKKPVPRDTPESGSSHGKSTSIRVIENPYVVHESVAVSR